MRRIILWFISDEESDLYATLQKAGFIVCFREYTSHMKWKKKMGVDVDIVFEVMKRLEEDADLGKIVLVSGDGDYIKMVKHLIKKGKLSKILSQIGNTLHCIGGFSLSIEWHSACQA